jgi:hypothetical protein
MKASNRGTLILEEAGELRMEDIEGVLTTRYSKSSAQTAKMVRPDGEGEYELEPAPTYGATIIHRQFSVRKPMLQRRLISIRTSRQQRAQPFTKFLELTEKDDGIDPETFAKKVHDYLTNLPVIPKVRRQWENVEPGILDTYMPIVAIAVALEDDEFLGEVIHEVRAKSADLAEDEGTSEIQTILRTFILLVIEKYNEAWVGSQQTQITKKITERLDIVVSEIEPSIRKEYGNSHPALLLSPQQRNRIIREDFGFKVVSSNGKYRAYFTLGVKNHLL